MAVMDFEQASERIVEGEDPSAVAASLGLSVASLRAALRRAGLPFVAAPRVPDAAAEARLLRLLFCELGVGLDELAARHGMHRLTMAARLRAAGVHRRPEGMSASEALADRPMLRWRVLAADFDWVAVAADLGVSTTALRRGVRVRVAEQARLDRDWLDAHIRHFVSVGKAAADLGMSPVSLQRRLRAAGIVWPPPDEVAAALSGSPSVSLGVLADRYGVSKKLVREVAEAAGVEVPRHPEVTLPRRPRRRG